MFTNFEISTPRRAPGVEILETVEGGDLLAPKTPIITTYLAMGGPFCLYNAVPTLCEGRSFLTLNRLILPQRMPGGGYFCLAIYVELCLDW